MVQAGDHIKASTLTIDSSGQRQPQIRDSSLADPVADIFVAYSAEDRERVRPLVEALKNLPFVETRPQIRPQVFWDRDLSAGDEFRLQIEAKLHDAGAVTVLWSHQSIHSSYVKEEAAIAIQQRKYIPFRVGGLPLEDIPVEFRRHQIDVILEKPDDLLHDAQKIRDIVRQFLVKRVPPVFITLVNSLRSELGAERWGRLEAERALRMQSEDTFWHAVNEQFMDKLGDDLVRMLHQFGNEMAVDPGSKVAGEFRSAELVPATRIPFNDRPLAELWARVSNAAEYDPTARQIKALLEKLAERMAS